MKQAFSASSVWRYALLILCLSAGVHQSKALPVCQNGSLADYMVLNSTGGCTVDALTFFRFAFAPAPIVTGGAAAASAADILVAPTINQYGVGFSFSSSFFSLSNSTVAQSAIYGIGYSVDPPPIIVGEDLFMDPPHGDATVLQAICLNDVLANSCAFGVPLQQSVTPASPLSTLQFPYAVPFVDLQMTITLRSTPGNPAGFDAIEAGTVVSSTPEPSTLGLGTLGILLGVALKRRGFKP